jgi:hypothetical protein
MGSGIRQGPSMRRKGGIMKSRALRIVIAAICLLCVADLCAQTYLSQMPPVERVKKEVRGADPIDTAARQAGVFWQLREVIDALAKSQGRNQYRLTPAEQALKQKYYVAYYEVWQPVQKALAQDGPRLFKLEGYTVDRDLLRDVLERLGSPTLRAEWSRLRGESLARHQAQVQAQQQWAKQEQERWKTRDQELLKAQPQQAKLNRQLARCLAAGRSESQCETAPPGLSLTGAYSLPSSFSMWFYPEYAHITCKDVKADAGYRIEMKNNQVQVKLVPSRTIGLGVKLPDEIMKFVPQSSNPDEWQGQRIAFVLRSDGKLSGSGPIKVSGSMTAGNRRREISASEARSYPGAERDAYGTWTVSEPTTVAKTSSCTLGVLNPTGPSPVLGSFESILETAFNAASDVVYGRKDKEKVETKMPPPGLKVGGSYVSQSGLDVQFYADAAVVSCRDATVARDYSVSISGNKLFVNIQNGGTPIQLEYKPAGTLVGSGSVKVNGRETDTCTLGVLTPGQPGSASTPPSLATTDATVPTQQSNPITAARPNNARASETPTGSGANAVLSVSSGFAAQPGASNPLAGKTLVLLKDSFENMLRKGGVQPPPGTSAMKVWLSACASRQALCQQGMMMGQAATAAGVVVDANGRARFSAVPPGTYFLFGSTQYNNQPFIWDLRVDLKRGTTNGVTLDQRNSAPINSQPGATVIRGDSGSSPDPALVTKAEQGDAEAQYKLGDYYFNHKDSQNGMKWTHKAAEQGHAAAQNSLGIRYFIGGSVQKDLNEAEKWFRKSSEQNFMAADNNLCKLFAQKVDALNGAIVPFPKTDDIEPLKGSAKDIAEAFAWCGKAAEQGQIESQFRLAALYAKGSRGVTPDYERAYFWLSIPRRPQPFRDLVSPHLTPEKREEIEKHARAWKPGTPSPFSPAAKHGRQ